MTQTFTDYLSYRQTVCEGCREPLTHDELILVIDRPQSFLNPEEYHYECPICKGEYSDVDFETLEEFNKNF